MRGMVVTEEDLEDPVDGSDVRKVAMAAIGLEEEEVGDDMVIVAVITVDAVVMVTR
jgi:hypothetical protein